MKTFLKIVGCVVLIIVTVLAVDMVRNGTKTVTTENGKTTTVYSYHTSW